MHRDIINKFFFVLLTLLPVSIIIGPAASLINILIFDFFFIILLIVKKNFDWIKSSIVKILLILYFYLIFNSFISLDPSSGLLRNLGFIRLIIFFIGLNYFLQDKKFHKIFYFWSIVILITIFDIFFERINGFNILGIASENQRRIASFFVDELIVGGYVYAFIFMLIGFYLDKYNNEKLFIKNFLLSLILITLLSVLLTGERSNSIKFILSLLIFFSLIDFITLKRKIFFLISLIIIFFITIVSNDYVKNRMYYSLKHSASTFIASFEHGQPWDNPKGNLYAKLYRSGYDVFKKYPYFGVGNKNYRIESCNNNFYQANIHKLRNDYVCMTHPHQLYFEFLSEHGFIGTLIILCIFFMIFFQSIRKIIFEKNYIGYGCLSYLLVIFTPILPSGAFFTDYNITLLILNLSVLYGCSKNLNIFNNYKSF